MFRPRTRYRIYSGVFLLCLVGVACFGAYSGARLAEVSPGDKEKCDDRCQAGGKGASVIAPKPADERIADYTWWLTFFTAVLGGASIIQGFFLLRADKTARIAANAARDTANEMSRNAELMEKQTALQAELADIAIKQKEISRHQFLGDHRPRLFVRRMKLVSLLKNDPIRIQYVLVNGGGSTATILEHETKIWVAAAAGGLIYENSPSLNDPTLAAGENCPCVTSAADGLLYDSTRNLTDHTSWSIDDPKTWALHFRGHITYADDKGTKRTTAFNRVYNPKRESMTPVGDPDYEYTD